MSNAPNIVVKKNTKRPSHVRIAGGLDWIAHLHQLWRIPRDRRGSAEPERRSA
jgi:hypothetical protein